MFWQKLIKAYKYGIATISNTGGTKKVKKLKDKKIKGGILGIW